MTRNGGSIALAGSERQAPAGARLVGPVEADAQVLVDACRRSVVLSGAAASFGAAFGVRLDRYEQDGVQFRGRTGPVSLPVELEPIVAGVFGLDTRPQARPHFRVADPAAVTAAFTPVEVAALYDFPSGTTGAEHRPGLRRRRHDRRPRPRQRAVGGLDQLGRAREQLDGPGPPGARRRVRRHGGARRGDLRRLGRQRFG